MCASFSVASCVAPFVACFATLHGRTRVLEEEISGNDPRSAPPGPGTQHAGDGGTARWERSVVFREAGDGIERSGLHHWRHGYAPTVTICDGSQQK